MTRYTSENSVTGEWGEGGDGGMEIMFLLHSRRESS